MVKEKFTFGECPDGMAIRKEVFCGEQGFVDEFDELDKRCWHLVLYMDGCPISTGRLIEEDPETYRIGRLAVRKPFRGKKVGTYTCKFLMNKALSLGARKVVLDSQIEAVPFYEKLGFKSLDGEVFLEEGHPHLKMYATVSKRKRPFKIDY